MTIILPIKSTYQMELAEVCRTLRQIFDKPQHLTEWEVNELKLLYKALHELVEKK